MFKQAAPALFVMLCMAGLSSVLCQIDSLSPELPKSVQELAKENTISYHTGVNSTEDTTLTSNNTESSIPAPAPLPVPAGGPARAAAPDLAPGPARAPSTAPAVAPSAAVGVPKAATSNTSAQSMPQKSPPIATPAATSRPPAPVATAESAVDGGAVASEKDLTRQSGASIASSSRYGAVAAGTLVVAVVIIGLTGTFMVWKRRSTSYQGLHDTEMALVRREH
ncbi:hypothetical protein ABBQ38_004155 [Trebouxia sp. C0009 RCD-2024]